jgi:hypothetical protein
VFIPASPWIPCRKAKQISLGLRYQIVIKREKKVPEASVTNASGTSLLIPTRKMKLNSKRFCLGDLIPFDFS